MGSRQSVSGWHREMETDVVDISPRGEEGMHIVHESCECRPRISRDTEGRKMINHNSWEGNSAFNVVENGRKAA